VNKLRKNIRQFIKEVYDQPNMDSWSKEDLKNASNFQNLGKFDFNPSPQEGIVDLNLDKLYNVLISKCSYFKQMEYEVEQKSGYKELMFNFHKENQSEDHSLQKYGITISIKYFTESKPALDREKGSLAYSTYFYIENVVDRTKDPERLLKPDEDQYNEEDPFDYKEDFTYDDEEFLDTINANIKVPKAKSAQIFVNDHLDSICTKIKKFDDYIKVTYDVDIF